MTQHLSESPVEDYERKLESQRDAVMHRILGLWARFLIGKILLCYGMLPENAWDIVAAILAAIGFALVLVSAAFAAVITLRNWSVLPRGTIALGLTPWLIVATEAVAILAMSI